MGIFKDCGCGCNGKRAQDKFVYSMISAVIFFTVANPATFRLMRRMLGKWVSSPNGCPSIRGLALHSAVFLLIVWGLMQVKPIEKESYAGEEGGMPGDTAAEDDEDDMTDDEDDMTDDEDDMMTDDEDDMTDDEDDMTDDEDEMTDDEDEMFVDEEPPFETPVEEYTSGRSLGPSPMGKEEASKLQALDLGMSDDLGAPIGAPVKAGKSAKPGTKKMKGSDGSYTSCKCSNGDSFKMLR